jgi:UDP-N-acetylmuramate dehydrogenase
LSLKHAAEILQRTATYKVEVDLPLAPLTTYRLGGPAALFVEPNTADELHDVTNALSEAGASDAPVLVLGRGSNVVISDEGFDGIVVHLGRGFAEVRPTKDGLTAGAAATQPITANRAAAGGRTGLEFMVGIPGSIGGAIRMNAGAHGAETGDVLERVLVLDLGSTTVEHRPASSLDLSYRHSNLTDREVVLGADFRLATEDPDAIRERTESYRRHRAETQPGALQNAGSTFKNPPGGHAGRLVDEAGLKGFSIGGVAVSDLHANFFVSSPGARAQDVFDLIREVRKRVMEATGVALEPEVRFVGRFEGEL